jgi:hypothetical protein
MYEMPRQEPNKPDEFLRVPAGEEEGIQVEQKRDLSFSAARGKKEEGELKAAEAESGRGLFTMTEKGEATAPAQESVIAAMEEAGVPQEVIEAAKEGGQSAESFVDHVTKWATTTSVGKVALGIVFSAALFGGKVSSAEAGENYWKDSAKMSQPAKEHTGEQEKKEGGNIEYVGFKPSQHEVLAIRAGLKKLVPDMVSAQIRVNSPYRYSPQSPATVNMKIDIMTSGGEAISTWGVPVFYEGGRADAAGMIQGLFKNLEQEVNKHRQVSEIAAEQNDSRSAQPETPKKNFSPKPL